MGAKMQELVDTKDFDYEAAATKVNGWGSDLELTNRGGVPKEMNRDTVLTGFHDPITVKQKPKVEILVTNERGSLTPVFSNSCPPKYLSGMMRRFAFRYSENVLTRWLTLMAADRVNMVEGWVEDIFRGKMPMILPRQEYRTLDHLRRIRQQGFKNKQDVVIVAATGIAAVGLAAGVIFLAKKALDKRAA